MNEIRKFVKISDKISDKIKISGSDIFSGFLYQENSRK